ncbi:protein FAR1-RELATED SEQUENCE 3 [Apium graveolens]|uniref:protein FAR1-RELATED SEQUENCE 3 n=1 Tax=Apium graveolens TaxID=4045 RepID=UPI003D796AA1
MMRGRGSEYEYDGGINNAGISVDEDVNGDAGPHVGMKFCSVDAAKTSYDHYARNTGFSTCESQPKYEGTVTVYEFGCAPDILKRKPGENCDAMLRIESKNRTEWVVTQFIKEHSHSLMRPNKVQCIRPRRHFAGTTSMKESNQGVRSIPNGLLSVSMNGNHVPVEINHCAKSANMEFDRIYINSGSGSHTGSLAGQRRTLGKNAQNLLDYFKKMQAENPGFYYAIQLDDENRMANVFWADSRSRGAYSYLGDAVTLDTVYRVNQYSVPFAPFTGVNHHGQTILFGCALLFDESEATFIWLFKTFLAAMGDQAPVSIITDQDKAIQAAVTRVLPETRHCISKWHVLREGQSKLGHFCHAYPNFQVDLYNCINLTVTPGEFEFAWDCILDKYDLRMNAWLQQLYNARKQWVPVYFRDTFFAAIDENQGFESSFFDGYVNQETTVPMFFKQYERALENSIIKEMEADFDTICATPVLRTPSPMEKQAANLYTKKAFQKFQEELVETFVYTADRIDGNDAIGEYRVAKFEDDQKAYIVSLNSPEMRAACSCQMFEYSGILCRHILTVFTVTNVFTLPSHYILRRWTRNAKRWVGSDDFDEVYGQEPLAVRYNSLCREAIKYAEEGAVAAETYSAARAALREGARKVMAVKKHGAKVAPPSSHVSVIGYEDSRNCSPDTTPLLWPRQDEMTRRFNLNDRGAPTQLSAHQNFPQMSLVSLRQDDVHQDNKAIFPFLKSMTWVMENKNLAPANRVAVINLKLQDYSRMPSAESEFKFSLSTFTLEPLLRSMACLSEKMSATVNKVATVNLKLYDTMTSSEDSEVKFKVSRDTLGAMLRSMAYIREQISNAVHTETHIQMPHKRPRR